MAVPACIRGIYLLLFRQAAIHDDICDRISTCITISDVRLFSIGHEISQN